MTPDLRDAARFFQALGDETRLRLLAELALRERTVGELVAILSCPQPNVSRHLKVLREVGLVRDRREGRNVSYELSTQSLWSPAAREWIEQLDLGLLPREPSAPLQSLPPGPLLAVSSTTEARARAREAQDESTPSRNDLDPFLL